MMQKLILEKLRKIEVEHNIEILYACESGSRAWGFASPDSDWDVRFIFRHSQDAYLSLAYPAEMFDWPIDEQGLDLVGWDVRKLLNLFYKSNATPFEWMQSPMVYQSNPKYNLREAMQERFLRYFRPRATANHYLGLAKKSRIVGQEGGQMNIKKYFYVLRPLLAAKWIVDRQNPAPMAFEPLLQQLKDNTALFDTISQLVEAKKKANESDNIDPIPSIEQFIEQEMDRCKGHVGALPIEHGDLEQLNQFYRTLIRK